MSRLSAGYRGEGVAVALNGTGVKAKRRPAVNYGAFVHAEGEVQGQLSGIKQTFIDGWTSQHNDVAPQGDDLHYIEELVNGLIEKFGGLLYKASGKLSEKQRQEAEEKTGLKFNNPSQEAQWKADLGIRWLSQLVKAYGTDIQYLPVKLAHWKDKRGYVWGVNIGAGALATLSEIFYAVFSAEAGLNTLAYPLVRYEGGTVDEWNETLKPLALATANGDAMTSTLMIGDPSQEVVGFAMSWNKTWKYFRESATRAQMIFIVSNFILNFGTIPIGATAPWSGMVLGKRDNIPPASSLTDQAILSLGIITFTGQLAIYFCTFAAFLMPDTGDAFTPSAGQQAKKAWHKLSRAGKTRFLLSTIILAGARGAGFRTVAKDFLVDVCNFTDGAINTEALGWLGAVFGTWNSVLIFAGRDLLGGPAKPCPPFLGEFSNVCHPFSFEFRQHVHHQGELVKSWRYRRIELVTMLLFGTAVYYYGIWTMGFTRGETVPGLIIGQMDDPAKEYTTGDLLTLIFSGGVGGALMGWQYLKLATRSKPVVQYLAGRLSVGIYKVSTCVWTDPDIASRVTAHKGLHAGEDMHMPREGGRDRSEGCCPKPAWCC